MTNFVTVDWDKDGFHLYDGSAQQVFSKEDYLAGKAFVAYPHTHIIDVAHLQPRTRKSKAQVYTQEELDELLEVAISHGVKIRAFPNSIFHRARTEAGLTSVDKDKDTLAMHQFTSNHPEVAFMAWPRTNQHLDVALLEQREDMDARLNDWRSVEYEVPAWHHAASILEHGFSPNVQRFFVDKIVHKGKPHQRIDWYRNGIMAVYVAVFDEDGSLRRDPNTGRPIGMRWAMRLWGMSPFHKRKPGGGIARSNLMYHRLRNVEIAQGRSDGTIQKFYDPKKGREVWESKLVVYPEIRRDFTKALKELKRLFQEHGE